jgi:ADP-heptose:LPS heptosyltransferase
MAHIIKKRNPKKQWSIRDFYENKDKILIVRNFGGLGDILIHRMMFEDIKLLSPEFKVFFACPKRYHPAVIDHPFLDGVLDSLEVDTKNYVVHYVTTSFLTAYERAMAPYSGKHRSDIWANHCGYTLTKHDMHIHLEPELRIEARNRLNLESKNHNGPFVAFCPISAMLVKNLTNRQQKIIVEELRSRGCFVYGLHNKEILQLKEINVPIWTDLSIRQWMAAIDVADYVVSVDTAAFHCAGGLRKPVLGIYTFCDGKVYSRYYQSELVQKHRDNGDWPCGPCYMWGECSKTTAVPKPCLTEITDEMLKDGINRMLGRWPITLEKIKTN